ncbi:hypothetical protein BKA80DRAFT_261335 [Phyllosticta citrichinensis]
MDRRSKLHTHILLHSSPPVLTLISWPRNHALSCPVLLSAALPGANHRVQPRPGAKVSTPKPK